MKCDYRKTLNICENHGYDCGRPTRANLFFIQYPDAPHKNGLPLVSPCQVDNMACPLQYNKEDSCCEWCMRRYWRAKVCNSFE